MKILKIICWVLTIFLLISGLFPLIYGIFHIGNIVLIVLAFLVAIFPFLLKNSVNKKLLKTFIISLYSLGVVVILLTSALMLRQAYFQRPPTTGELTVIVLGAKVNGDQPSNVLRNRLIFARRYLEENPQATVITSGGQGDDEIYPEGEVMANWLIKNGIDPNRVIVENKSTNTRENLTFSKVLIPKDSQGIVIVTDNFHQLRGALLAQSLGMSPIYSTSSYSPYGLIPCYWARDMGGVILTWIQENILK